MNTFSPIDHPIPSTHYTTHQPVQLYSRYPLILGPHSTRLPGSEGADYQSPPARPLGTIVTRPLGGGQGIV